MRPILSICLLATAASAPAASTLAQTTDRYGAAASPAPIQQQQAAQQQAAPATPTRVLSWPGKTIPVAPPPQAAAYGYPPYTQAKPAYGAQYQPSPSPADPRAAQYPTAPAAYSAPPARPYPPQGYAPPLNQAPQGYAPQPQARPLASYPSNPQPQRYYAPAPGMPAPGPAATAPNAVYPANTAPPQMAYPMAAPPTGSPQQPASIYAPPQGPAPQAAAQRPELNGSSGLGDQARPNPTDPSQPRRVAMNAAGPTQSARLYSLHREFGLTPDPTPAPTPRGETVELVSSIDSGGAPNPDADAPAKTVKMVTDSSGKTTAQLRSSASDAQP